MTTNPPSGQPSARPPLRIAGWAVGLVAAGLIVASVYQMATHEREQRPSGTFCMMFTDVPGEVDEARLWLTGQPHPDGMDSDTMRFGAKAFWSDSVADGAPNGLRTDARTIARAMRRAILEGDVEAIHTHRFEQAVERMDKAAPKACEGRG